MNRHQVELPLHEHHGAIRSLHVVRYGHWGRPVLVFPSEAGRAWDFENNGMVEAVRPLIEAGRVKLYCVDSLDAETWSDRWLPTEERARRNGAYTRWLIDQVVPFIHGETGGAAGPGSEIVTLGCSLGAYHAVQFTLQRADLAPLAIGLSGNYDPSTWNAWGEIGEALYFANPTAYVPHLHGDHLDWLRERVSILLVVGQGAWETHPTGALPSSVRFAEILRGQRIRSELDLWGHDVSHDWDWWARQLAHHLPRFC